MAIIDQIVIADVGGTQADVTASNALKVDGSAVTQPISAASLPLPTGAATAANQTTIIGHVDGIETILGTIDADTGTIAGAVSGSEMQVDVITLPALPAGNNNIGDVDVASLPALATGNNVIGQVKITDGSDIADVWDLTNSNPLVVAIVDGDGNQITSLTGNTEYTEDAATPANPVGGAIMGRFRGTLSSEGIADGDWVTINATESGQLRVFLDQTVDVTGSVEIAAISSAPAYVRLSDGSVALEGQKVMASSLPVVIASNQSAISVDSELPAAAALADNTANPTVPSVGVLNLGYDGSTWDRLRTTEGMVNTAGTETGLLAAGVGPGFSRQDTSQTITANAQSRTFNTKGTEQLGITLTGTWTGTVVFEYTTDGSNWIQDSTGVDASTLLQTSGQTTANGTWFFDSSSVVQYRVRSTAWTSGTLNINFIGSMGSAITYGAIINARHDRFGAAPVHKDGEWTSTQTGTAIWTPASGKKFVVTGLTISTGGTTAGIVTIWQGASGDTTYTAGTDPALFRGEFAPSSTSKPGAIKTYKTPYVSTTADHVLRITTSAAMTVYVQVDGYEI